MNSPVDPPVIVPPCLAEAMRRHNGGELPSWVEIGPRLKAYSDSGRATSARASQARAKQETSKNER